MADTTNPNPDKYNGALDNTQMTEMIRKGEDAIAARFPGGIPISEHWRSPAGFATGEDWHAGTTPIQCVTYLDPNGSQYHWTAKVDTAMQAEDMLRKRVTDQGESWESGYSIKSIMTLEQVYAAQMNVMEVEKKPETEARRATIPADVQFLIDRKAGHSQGDYTSPPPVDSGDAVNDGVDRVIDGKAPTTFTDAVAIHAELLDAVGAKSEHRKSGAKSAYYDFDGPWAYLWLDELERAEAWAFNAIYDGNMDSKIDESDFDPGSFFATIDQLVRVGAYRSFVYLDLYGMNGNVESTPYVIDTDGDGTISEEEARYPAGYRDVVIFTSTQGDLPQYAKAVQPDGNNLVFAQRIIDMPDSIATDLITDILRSKIYEQPIRARNADGTYIADDPSTETNEAWVGGTAPTK